MHGKLHSIQHVHCTVSDQHTRTCMQTFMYVQHVLQAIVTYYVHVHQYVVHSYVCILMQMEMLSCSMNLIGGAAYMLYSLSHYDKNFLRKQLLSRINNCLVNIKNNIDRCPPPPPPSPSKCLCIAYYARMVRALGRDRSSLYAYMQSKMLLLSNSGRV